MEIVLKNEKKCHCLPCHRSTTRGFTLIELMVVCAIIFVIAVVIVPSFLRALGKGKKQQGAKVTQQAPESPRLRFQPDQKGSPPIYDRENVTIALATRHHRIGMDVYTRFEAAVKGVFIFSRAGRADEAVLLDFRFPEGTTEARDVALKLSTGSSSWEPQGVIYDREGIFWVGSIQEKEIVKAEISFVAMGRDRFEYHLPPGQRTRQVTIDLSMDGDTSSAIPDQALQPTSLQPGHISWNFSNLVTDRAIIVDLPGAQSPIGRVMLLCKLVGMAVLLFGAGFWYLAELYQPGGLHKFRWAHFFLLALTYSLFFVIFGVLGFRGDLSTWTAMGISAILSLPLLALHVSRIIDMNFALSRTLPLAIFTLALVVNGVYGGAAKDYNYIGAAFIVIAFITITFRKWASNREKWTKTLEQSLSEGIEALGGKVVEAKELDKKAGDALRISDPSRLSEIRADLDNCRKNMMNRFSAYDSILADLSRLRSLRNLDERQVLRDTLRDKVALEEQLLPAESDSLQTALSALIEQREIMAGKGFTPDAGKTHCLSCGFPGDPTPFCPNCGTPRPRVIVCQKCGEHMKIPLHLVDRQLMKGSIYCSTCGEKHSLDSEMATGSIPDSRPLD